MLNHFLYTCLFILLIPLSGWSQSTDGWSFLINGGTAISNFTGKNAVRQTFLHPGIRPTDGFDGNYYADGRGGKLYSAGWYGGIGVQKRFGKKLSLQLNAIIFSAGSKLNTTYEIPRVTTGFPPPLPDSLKWHGQTSFSILYLKVPIVLQYRPIEKIPVFVSGGLYYAHKLKEEERGKIFNNGSGKESTYHHPNDYYRKTDFGYILGAGYDFKLSGRESFGLTIHYSQSILTISQRMTPNTPQYYNQSFSLGLSYVFHWNSK